MPRTTWVTFSFAFFTAHKNERKSIFCQLLLSTFRVKRAEMKTQMIRQSRFPKTDESFVLQEVYVQAFCGFLFFTTMTLFQIVGKNLTCLPVVSQKNERFRLKIKQSIHKNTITIAFKKFADLPSDRLVVRSNHAATHCCPFYCYKIAIFA
jgi:hypothetical protein